MFEENKAIIRRDIEEVWDKGHLEVVDELYAKDYAGHIAASTTTLDGPEAVKQLLGVYHFAYPDIHFTINDQVAEGDLVATRWTARGTHQGDFSAFTENIAPTGEKLIVTGMSFHRIVDGRIKESWMNWDALGMLQSMTGDLFKDLSLGI